MKICNNCIYDETIPYIKFNNDGVCNYCERDVELDKEYPVGEEGGRILNDVINQMKKDGKRKKYDVIVGVSGGCDSSYLLHLAVKCGLRPLAVHFDNTWNSKIAVENIERMITSLDIDLYTHVVDNKEYNDLVRSFFLASVPDLDSGTDLAIGATLYKAAEEYGIKWIWNGHSFRTEGISPQGWFYQDAKYVRSIHKLFGKTKLTTLPLMDFWPWMRQLLVKRIKRIRPLYYLDYDKEQTKKFLHDEYGWEWYGGHHMENRSAYFVNNFYLPNKFGIDLRKCEYSALIRSGQMTRKLALIKMMEDKEMDDSLIVEMKKRLDLTDEQFNDIMTNDKKDYTDYPTYKRLFERLRPFFYVLYRLNLVPKSFYLKYANKRNY
tara:strand:- start:785 stop:1918 length:1134 start_codon:yes stop_codon:yes gene_type:complete